MQMRGRGEVTNEEWAVLEPLLRFERRPDGRGRRPKDAREVLNGVLWILRTGAQSRELPAKYPLYQTCHRRFQRWVRNGQLEKALRVLAETLHEKGLLDLDEGFIDGSFASAKKGASRWEKPSGARGQRSWLSPLLPVFLWPSTSIAHPRTNRNSSGKHWREASSMNFRRG
jgi:transposase